MSLRAVRSMLGQIFARIYWYVRFEKPYSLTPPAPPAPLDAEYANRLARPSNAAIQEVMAS